LIPSLNLSSPYGGLACIRNPVAQGHPASSYYGQVMAAWRSMDLTRQSMGSLLPPNGPLKWQGEIGSPRRQLGEIRGWISLVPGWHAWHPVMTTFLCALALSFKSGILGGIAACRCSPDLERASRAARRHLRCGADPTPSCRLPPFASRGSGAGPMGKKPWIWP
jgi:hypothetical protein